MHRLTFRAVVLFTLALCLGGVSTAEAGVQASFVKGQAFQGSSERGPWRPLSRAATIATGDYVKTGDDGIVELTLPDKSVIRLAPDSLYHVEEAEFPEQAPRKWSAKLFFGKLWANVQKRTGIMSGRFDTRVPTAVVGVRGTVYNLAAARDSSTDVYVYDGVVGVGPPMVAEGAAREEVAWPAQVSEKQWEEIILAKLQRLHIGADGRPGKPQAFDPEAEMDDWVAFNQERDAELNRKN